MIIFNKSAEANGITQRTGFFGSLFGGHNGRNLENADGIDQALARQVRADAVRRERQKNDNLISLRGVVKVYTTGAGKFVALKGVNLEAGRGEFLGIVGKSGSGKSTLINTITGIDRPTKGEVFVAKTPVHTLSEGKMAEWRGRNVGVIFQFFQLLPTLSIVENVMLPMDFCDMYPARERTERALGLLDLVGLADCAYKLPSAVSGGQQQRVAIARALANDPPIIVADEPTGNLDSKTANSVFELFETLVESGKTIVMVTHDRDLAKRVTRTITIADGEIVEDTANSRRKANEYVYSSEYHHPGFEKSAADSYRREQRGKVGELALSY